MNTRSNPVVGPFDADAREVGYVEPVLPHHSLSVMYAVHGPEGVEDRRIGDLDWLRDLLRACQHPSAYAALLGYPEDHPLADPDATLQMIRGVEDMYRRLAKLTGWNSAIYDSERAVASEALVDRLLPKLRARDAELAAEKSARDAVGYDPFGH